MKKQMSCNDFLDILNNDGFFSDLHSNMFWSKEVNVVRLFEHMKHEATKRGIILIDESDWDYDTELYKNYKDDEDKSLS